MAAWRGCLEQSSGSVAVAAVAASGRTSADPRRGQGRSGIGAQAPSNKRRAEVGFPPISAVRRNCREVCAVPTAHPLRVVTAAEILLSEWRAPAGGLRV
jgi:hypothetical protein